MKVLSSAIASTFVRHRKYFQQASQVLSFFEAVLRLQTTFTLEITLFDW